MHNHTDGFGKNIRIVCRTTVTFVYLGVHGDGN
jgi:hypothetical protein